MGEWKEVLLTEVTTKIGDGLHGTPKYDEKGEYYFINGNNLYQGKIIVKQDTKRVSNIEFEKYQKPLSENTILLGINGTIGNVALFNDEKCVLGKSACYINVNESVSRRFLYYNILNNDFQTFLQTIATGTTIPNVPLKGLRDYSFLLPPLQEQERIAEVLSSLDDKIDLLHRQNKTLEEMAETLFRQWFVEEAEDSWEEVKLGGYVNLVSGYSYRSVDLNSSTKALVTLKNFDRTGGFRHDGFKEYTGKYKEDQVVVSGDLIVAHTDITQEAEVLGNPAIVISTDKYEKLVISTDLVKVVPSSYLSKVYLYFLMKTDEFKHYCLGASNGTTVMHLSKKALPEYDFKLPSAELVNRFTLIAQPLLEKININQKHIQQLETLRDTLLPKLMSGSVTVNEIA
jgi:type I restriction enzyme, S subunit